MVCETGGSHAATHTCRSGSRQLRGSGGAAIRLTRSRRSRGRSSGAAHPSGRAGRRRVHRGLRARLLDGHGATAIRSDASDPLACPLRLPIEVAALSPRGESGADDHGKAAAREPLTVHAVEEIDRQQRQDDERRDADGAGTSKSMWRGCRSCRLHTVTEVSSFPDHLRRARALVIAQLSRLTAANFCTALAPRTAPVAARSELRRLAMVAVGKTSRTTHGLPCSERNGPSSSAFNQACSVNAPRWEAGTHGADHRAAECTCQTSARAPFDILYAKEHESVDAAIRRERQLKRLERSEGGRPVCAFNTPRRQPWERVDTCSRSPW